MADQEFNIRVVTSADVAGIRQTEAALDALGLKIKSIRAVGGGGGGGDGTDVLDKAAAKIEHGIFRTFVHAIGIGVVYELVGSLKKAGEEIEKVSDALNKQGEELVRHVQLYSEQARHAKDTDDVLKISSATLKDIETTQKTVNDLSQKELGYAATVSDYLQKQMFARQRMAGMGDYEAAQQENLKTAVSQALEARQRGMDEVIKAEKASNQTTEEHLGILNREIALEEKRKAAAAANVDPGGYVKAANNLGILKKQLEEFIQLEIKEQAVRAKQQEEAYGKASPQAKAILENEKRAKEARAAGDEKSAEQFQKTADQLRKSATPADLAAVQAVTDTYGKAGRPGRLAGVGESQALVDEQERQRIAAENAQRATNEPGGETGSGGPSLIGPAAERARREGIQQTGKDSATSLADKMDKMIELQRQQLGIWR